MALIGKDRLAWLSLGQLSRMVADISSSHLSIKLHRDKKTRAEARVVDNTIWGVYNLTASEYLSFTSAHKKNSGVHPWMDAATGKKKEE